jgi:hypothetical protein
MKISFKILSITIFLFLTKGAMAQFTNVRYNYDANGNRWQRLIEFSLNKTNPLDTTGYSKSINNPYKETILDSFGIKEIVIFPNPTFEKVKVNIISTIATPLSGTIKVFDILGSTQYFTQSLVVNNEVNFSTLAAGTYMLRIEVNGNIKIFKVIKN